MEIKQITDAIIKVMSEVKNIGKNTTVGKGGNSYKAVSDADVKRAIRASMETNGLSIVCTGVSSRMKLDRWEEDVTWNGETTKKTKQSVFTEVDTTYLLLHTSGESLTLAGYGQGVDTQDKGAGKATTYALKNTLINTFLIPTGEDTDNTHSDDIAVPQKKYVNNDNLPWIGDDNIKTLKGLLAEGKTMTLKGVREKYKVSRENAEKLKGMGII